MKNKYSFSVLISALLLAFSTIVQAESEVSFNTDLVKARAGDAITLDVMMSDFPVVEGGGLVLRYNPKRLMVASVTIDNSVWDFVNKDGVVDNSGGVVSDILFSSYRGVGGDARIATIEFQVIKKGKSMIRLLESAVNPFASNGESVGVTFGSTQVRARR